MPCRAASSHLRACLPALHRVSTIPDSLPAPPDPASNKNGQKRLACLSSDGYTAAGWGGGDVQPFPPREHGHVVEAGDASGLEQRGLSVNSGIRPEMVTGSVLAHAPYPLCSPVVLEPNQTNDLQLPVDQSQSSAFQAGNALVESTSAGRSYAPDRDGSGMGVVRLGVANVVQPSWQPLPPQVQTQQQAQQQLQHVQEPQDLCEPPPPPPRNQRRILQPPLDQSQGQGQPHVVYLPAGAPGLIPGSVPIALRDTNSQGPW